MHPVLTVLDLAGRPLPVASYGLSLAVALWVGVGLAVLSARRAGMDPGAVIAAAGVAVGGGFAGAVALHALVQLLRPDPAGYAGLSVMGGLASGLVSLRLACRVLGLPWLALADHAAVPTALAQAVGRVGCLLGGCCYGAHSELPWAVRYTHAWAPAAAELPRHPWPLYEALGLGLLALALATMRPPGVRPAPRSGRAGRRFAAYAAGYCLLRFALEPLRADAVRGVWGPGLSTAQLLSLIGFAGIVWWWQRGRREARGPAAVAPAVRRV